MAHNFCLKRRVYGHPCNEQYTVTKCTVGRDGLY
jgi:hypothetical protein